MHEKTPYSISIVRDYRNDESHNWGSLPESSKLQSLKRESIGLPLL
jgi:hypothetical protein